MILRLQESIDHSMKGAHMDTKILIVDDSKSDRTIIEKLLNEYEVLTAENGVEALDIISKNEIDILILDINMPKMDGFEVLRHLKDTNRYKRLRTLILTNYNEIDNEIKGLQLGAVDYIRKPVNMYSLKARIQTHLELLKIQQLFEQKSHQEFLTVQTILKQAPLGIAFASRNVPLAIDSKDETIHMNAILEKITGYDKAKLLSLGWQSIIHPDDLEKDLKLFKELENSESTSYETESRFIKPDKTEVWINLIIAKLNLNNSYKYNYIYLMQDISKRKAAESLLQESEQSKAVLVDNLPGMMYRCKNDKEWTMLYVSNGCYELTGYNASFLLNNHILSYNDLIKPEYRDLILESWQMAINDHTKFLEEYEIMMPNGTYKWVWEQGQAIYDQNGQVKWLEGLIIDIDQRKTNEILIKHASEHDSLTDILNLRSLENTIITQQQEGKIKQASMVMIYIRRYSHLVTSYGYKVGNQLILEVANILKELNDDKHMLYHPFNDRFIFLVHGYHKPATVESFVQKIVRELDNRVKQRTIGFSIGIIEIDHNKKNDVVTLLRQAAIASDHFNVHHNISYSFYDKKIAEHNTREKLITESLENYLVDERSADFFLVYQPIIEIKTNKIIGFEALARFRHQHLGNIMPNEFIPVTESSLLILPYGKKIIEKAFAFSKKIEKAGHKDVIIALNVSAIQLLNDNFIKDLISLIKHNKVSPKNINIEVTESIFSDSYQEINRKLDEIHKLGIQVSIDDFGTGYSSLAREEELNVNILKIDRHFVSKLSSSDPKKNLISDIISMAHKLGHQVIAEGVENKEQLDYLRQHDCDMYQGFYFSKALLEEDALKLLNHKR